MYSSLTRGFCILVGYFRADEVNKRTFLSYIKIHQIMYDDVVPERLIHGDSEKCDTFRYIRFEISSVHVQRIGENKYCT